LPAGQRLGDQCVLQNAGQGFSQYAQRHCLARHSKQQDEPDLGCDGRNGKSWNGALSIT
jgi:hypothetical protein